MSGLTGKAAFLSYASQDAQMAREIAAALSWNLIVPSVVSAVKSGAWGV